MADEADRANKILFVVRVKCLLDFFSKSESEQVDVARSVSFIAFAIDKGEVWPVYAEIVLDL